MPFHMFANHGRVESCTVVALADLRLGARGAGRAVVDAVPTRRFFCASLGEAAPPIDLAYISREDSQK